MAQHDMDVANGSGAAVRADINSALGALVTLNSGATAPSPTFANMFWGDTTANRLKKRNNANSAWLDWMPLDGVPGLASGPGTSVNGNAAIWAGTGGQTLADAGFAPLGQGKQTIWVPAAAMIPRATNPPASASSEMATNRNMVAGYDFDAATNQFLQFSVAMPKSWNLSTLTAQFVWSAPSGSGNVIWGLQGVAVSDGDSLDAAYGTAQTVTDTFLAANQSHLTAETSAITIAGSPAAFDTVLFQAYRDAANGSDTFSALARLLGVRLYYSVNVGNDA
jgi:hypothetical protein